jgi:ATP-dependent DNA ligase
MASPARPDLPDWLGPELATLTRDRFSDREWIFERKLDGERCLAFKSGGRVRLMTRNQKEDTSTYPEITRALAAQQADDFIIDGEIVAFDGGQTRFARLQQRLGVRHPGPDLLAQVPVYYYIFDVLWADDHDVRSLRSSVLTRVSRSAASAATAGPWLPATRPGWLPPRAEASSSTAWF